MALFSTQVEQFSSMEKYQLMEIGDCQILLGREVCRDERGLTTRLNRALLESIVNLAGVGGGRTMKLPGVHHRDNETRRDTATLSDSDLRSFVLSGGRAVCAEHSCDGGDGLGRFPGEAR